MRQLFFFNLKFSLDKNICTNPVRVFLLQLKILKVKKKETKKRLSLKWFHIFASNFFTYAAVSQIHFLFLNLFDNYHKSFDISAIWHFWHFDKTVF